MDTDIRYEDDTDEANGIQIKFKNNAERSISGRVFEDKNKDNERNNDDKYVNDVIVQLIELVDINEKQYEYIWQETVTGGKKKENGKYEQIVKTTARNGYEEDSYTVTNSEGEYKFTERIIPGNYIVRFIYGDGTYFDTNIDGSNASDETKNNIKTYNGEDYKSTQGISYTDKWHNNHSYSHEASRANDNESRRLSVMSYGVDVNEIKGEALALLDKNIGTNDEKLKEVLSNTWMCAETTKIKMPVDSTEQKNIDDTTTIDYGSKQFTKNTQFTNVNFGLMERPKTKLVLEKHITGLTIKPVESGVGLIANATADINEILTKTNVNLEGQIDGLTMMKSSRTERGFWKVETDTTELAQGADAYITYTYVIRNKGEEDYLSLELINAYKDNKGTVDGKTYDSYEKYLDALGKYVKEKIKSKDFTKGTYLSKYYYLTRYKSGGNTDDSTIKVLASVVQIQETLNPKVKFVNTTTDFNNASQNPEASYYYYNREGQLTDGEKISEIITNKTPTKKLEKGQNDTDKKLVVSVGLSASEIENGGVYDSYIAQITHYTNAAGRRDQSSTPANLSYVHSYDTDITLENYNEEDEFWAERFIITKPTGEDKLTAVQIAIISVSAVVILGVGIILIKKFVLKK